MRPDRHPQVQWRMHKGEVVSANLTGDPLAHAKFLASVAKKQNDEAMIEAAQRVLEQMTTLVRRFENLSLPGDQELMDGYVKLRGDYLMLTKAFCDMRDSNEMYRAAVVDMGAAMSASGMETPVVYLRAISEDTVLPNAQSTDADWPDPDTVGDNAK